MALGVEHSILTGKEALHLPFLRPCGAKRNWLLQRPSVTQHPARDQLDSLNVAPAVTQLGTVRRVPRCAGWEGEVAWRVRTRDSLHRPSDDLARPSQEVVVLLRRLPAEDLYILVIRREQAALLAMFGIPDQLGDEAVAAKSGFSEFAQARCFVLVYTAEEKAALRQIVGEPTGDDRSSLRARWTACIRPCIGNRPWRCCSWDRCRCS